MNKIKRLLKFMNMKFFLSLIVIALGFFGACNYINEKVGLENDNIFEQQIENIIEHETGIDIDLSD